MSFTVYHGTERIGELQSEGARLRFRYRPEVADAGRPALSVRLPPRREPFLHDEANPYFANLLPEEEHRRLLARVLGMSDRNVAGLLGAIGGECAGAVSIWPTGRRPPAKPDYVPLDDAHVQRLLDATSPAERLDIVRESRLSLAGGMEKLGLRLVDDRWHRGRAGAPTTHILKWAPRSLPDLNYNELFCMELLGAAGLPIAEATVEGGITPVLVVQRYDRIEQADGRLTLLHQEDFCQALGVEPAQKYQAEGGPSLASCAAILRRHAAVPARELSLLLRWAVGNFLVGNGDAHGKNLALLYAPEGVRLAPFYDIASTRVYKGLSGKLAMAIGGEYRIAYVQARHWDRLADALGLPANTVRREVLALAAAVEMVLPAVRERLTDRYGDQEIFARIQHLVIEQIERVRRQLLRP